MYGITLPTSPLAERSICPPKADETGVKTDIADGMSEVGGIPDVNRTWPESPLVATSGHSSAPCRSKIRPSDGGGRDAVPLAVERCYDFPDFGGYLGNFDPVGKP